MPLATSVKVFTSFPSSSEFTGNFCGESNRAPNSASQIQKVSAMREIKNAATENFENFSKLPNLRILEVLGVSQSSKYLERPVVADKQSNDSAACVPMTIAVAEFKGPEVHGVVRFAQDSTGHQECSIEANIDGLAPGVHGWSVHEFGDLTQGPWSTGPAYTFSLPAGNPSSFIIPQEQGQNDQQELGNLGSLVVDKEGHVQSTGSDGRISVADIIGRSVVLYGPAASGNGNGCGDGARDASDTTRVAAAVIARSARPSSLAPQLCHCDGSLLWQGNANSCS